MILFCSFQGIGGRQFSMMFFDCLSSGDFLLRNVLPCADFFLHRGHARSASFFVPLFISDCAGNLLCQHWKSQDRLQFETLSSKLFKYLKHQSSNKNSSSKNRMIHFCFFTIFVYRTFNIFYYIYIPKMKGTWNSTRTPR